MLENIRDYPRDIVKIYFKNYENGILTGCEVTVKEDERLLLVQPGALVTTNPRTIIDASMTMYNLTEDKKVKNKFFIKKKFAK